MLRVHAADTNGNAKCYDETGDGYDAFVPAFTLDGVPVDDPDDVISTPPTQNKTGGYYDFKVTPKAAGTYAFSASLNGVNVSGTSTVTVTEGALDASSSTVDGAGLFGGLSGVKHFARVVARDAHGNPITNETTTPRRRRLLGDAHRDGCGCGVSERDRDVQFDRRVHWRFQRHPVVLHRG